MRAAENACNEGFLIKTLLLPEGLGGRDCPENVVYIPPHAWEIKDNSTVELLNAVGKGMVDVAVVPTYRGMSFVPTQITITAAHPGMPLGYMLEIEIW